jgi:hypothetical protein
MNPVSSLPVLGPRVLRRQTRSHFNPGGSWDLSSQRDLVVVGRSMRATAIRFRCKDWSHI